FVAVHLANKGLFVFTACSHAGLINVLTHAAERFPGIPLFGVLGGFHLAGPTEAIILETVDALEALVPVRELKVVCSESVVSVYASQAAAAGASDGSCSPGSSPHSTPADAR